MLFCWLLFSIGLTYFVAIFIVYDYLFSRCLTTRKEKTDRPPRELIPKDSMKAAGAAVLDGKPVNAVGRESSVTHMTLEQYVRKSELLQTPYVDQFMPQLKFSQLKKRERCPITFYAQQSFTAAFLGKQPGHPINHVETYSNCLYQCSKQRN